MKFLSIWELKERLSLPPVVMRQLAEGQTDYTKQSLKKGEINEIYYIPGWGRWIIIADDKSAEDWLKSASGSPMFMFYNVEVYPLADWNESANMMIENLKKAEKMASSMPK